jgi:hypothetical protein
MLQLYHNQGAVSMNCHQIDVNAISDTYAERNDTTCIGKSLYPVLPLLSHSCKANTSRFNSGNAVVVIATEDIAAGQEVMHKNMPNWKYPSMNNVFQVSDSYGMSFLTANRDERQDYFKKRFLFDCACRACAGNYPTYDLLPSTLSDYASEIYDSDVVDARKILQEGFWSGADRQKLEIAKEKCLSALKNLDTNHIPFIHTSREKAVALLETSVRRLYMPAAAEAGI